MAHEQSANKLTSGLRVWRMIHLIHNLLLVSEQSITRSITQVSPSGPLYTAGVLRYSLEQKEYHINISLHFLKL